MEDAESEREREGGGKAKGHLKRQKGIVIAFNNIKSQKTLLDTQLSIDKK